MFNKTVALAILAILAILMVSGPAHGQGFPKKNIRIATARLAPGMNYGTLINLDSDYLTSHGRRLKLVPGMQVSAEIHLGTLSVIEYLLSPVQRVAHEAGRER